MDDLTPDTAKAEIDTLKSDPAWIKGYLDGDTQKHERMTQLHEAAFSAIQAEGLAAKPADQASEGQASADEVLDVDPPSGPWEYDFGRLEGEQDTPENEKALLDVANALHAAKVPTFAVKVVQMAAHRNMTENYGEPFTDEQLQKMDRACRFRLNEKHGEEQAKRILADAQKALKRIGSEQVEMFLDESGTGSDPHVIETLARLERGYFSKAA